MDTNKKNKTILDRLDKVELELLQHDTEYAKQFLIEEGIDPDKEIEFSGQFMKKIRFMALGMSNKQRDLKLLDVAFDKLKEVLKENGYYVDNLWHIDDVKQHGDLSNEEAYDILDSTLRNDYTIETINILIKENYKSYICYH